MSELNRLSTQEFRNAKKYPFVVILDNVRSTLNVGSVFRTADAFKAEKIILTGLTPTPSKEMNKTALGATEAVAWEHFSSPVATIKLLKSNGYQVWAVEQVAGSKTLLDYRCPAHNKQAFVFGNEVNGVSEEVLAICDGCLEIPQYGTKHSLNISVSAGIIMWEYLKQMKS
jgi:tRNA G18 (ribose-2'-O)-methylase SpoU